MVRTLANVHRDVISMWGRTRDVSVIGYGQNRLEDVLAPVAARQGRTPGSQAAAGWFGISSTRVARGSAFDRRFLWGGSGEPPPDHLGFHDPSEHLVQPASSSARGRKVEASGSRLAAFSGRWCLSVRNLLAAICGRSTPRGLRDIQDGDREESEDEPPVPPGMQSLSSALIALADLLEIDGGLIAVAAEASAEIRSRVPDLYDDIV